MEVGLVPVPIVLDADPSPPPQRGRAQFSAHMCVVAKLLDAAGPIFTCLEACSCLVEFGNVRGELLVRA